MKASYFAIYDGHGGSWCSELLKNNLHKYIFADPKFPSKPKIAIENGFESAEKEILKQQTTGKSIDKSGSCAIVVIVFDNKFYVAHLGDSTGIVSALVFIS